MFANVYNFIGFYCLDYFFFFLFSPASIGAHCFPVLELIDFPPTAPLLSFSSPEIYSFLCSWS